MQNDNAFDKTESEIPSEDVGADTVLTEEADDTAPEEIQTLPATRKDRLHDLWSKYGYLFVCFALPAAIMLLMHFAMRVWPFGERSVLVLDLNGQYVYYFEALRKIVYGDGSFLYSFGRTLGGEFLGIFAYYLASPLSFIVALFPKKMITEALLVLLVLKTGLSGLTFGVYIHNTRKRNTIATVIFSTMYALTAYGVVYQHNTMWIDNVILLPLILLGIEEMIKHGKYKLFVITLSMAVLSNYYIGYMTCIFVAVYFFYAYFSRTPEERNPLGVSHHFAKSFGRIALYSAIVIAISAIMILPAYYSLSFGKSTFSNPSYAVTTRFDLLDLLSMMFVGSYDTVRPEGLPLVYSGTLTFLLLPLYFLAPHIKTREKVAGGLLTLFFVMSFNISVLDLIWHGFQKPNWLNNRYSFMLCFMMILFAYKAFERIREIGHRYVIGSAAAIALLAVILQKLEYVNTRELVTVWATILLLAVYICILRAVSVKDKETKRTATLILAIVVSLEAFCAGYFNLTFLDNDVYISPRSGYRSFMERVQPVVDQIKEDDDSFYRMEKTVFKKVNDNLTLGMRGLSNSTSTLNSDVIKMFNRFGLASKAHWTKYLGSTPVVDSLMSLKYLITEKNNTLSPMYEEMFTHDDDLVAYRNPHSLSLAFGVDETLADFDFYSDEYKNPFMRMNALLGEMTGAESPLGVFEPISDELTLKNAKVSLVTGHKKYYSETGSTGKVCFTFTAPQDGLVYMYFPSDYAREVDLYIDGRQDGTFYANESFAIRPIGPYKEGDVVRVEMSLKKDEVYLATNTPFFYTLNEDAYKSAMEILSISRFTIDSFTEDSFYGKIRVADGQNLIYTSIPYDEGWVVKVDGKVVEKTELLGALMGFRVPGSGEYTLSLEYRPDCVKFGAILSLTGVVAFVAICAGEAILKRRKQKKGSKTT